jgi:succinate dehydrogenase/fumarate reductase flavoprotein subunit
MWEEWGIPMKQNGEWIFAGHAFAGRMRQHLKYKGRNQKLVLTEQALKRGVKMMNRIMIFDLLGDRNGVSGAIGIDTREDRLFIFEAGSVFLATGAISRTYPNIIPGMLGNNSRPFTITGDGRAMAYRLGADLANFEMFVRHAGPKNYARSGQASWAGVVRDSNDQPVGKYLTRPDIRYSDMVMEVDKQIFERSNRAGSGPLYNDCRGLSDEDLQKMTRGLEDEGNIGTLRHFEEEGVDLSENPIEFATYEPRPLGRIVVNEKAETSIPGLFAGGDEAGQSISNAAVFGWIGGGNAADYAKKVSGADPYKLETQVKEKEQWVGGFQTREDGPDWQDANMALMHTMADYAGLIRSESLLTAGLRHLVRLKEKMHNTVAAKDRWELTRCLEVVNLFDIGELIFIGALERKESRGLHQRADYPYTDPLLNNQMLLYKLVDGKHTVQWRPLPA